MFKWQIEGRHFHIREARNEDEFHTIEDLQREAWQFSDLDVVPFATLIASQWAGGVVLVALEADTIIGFAYGFPAYERGQVSIHSHMLAVKPEWRNLQAGFYLKLAQREWVLERGLGEITWTFDPLQSLNAHLNFSKLGVVSERYIVNFYGEASSSPLHKGFGTDRLWVRWLLNSDRVTRRIKGEKPPPYLGLWPPDLEDPESSPGILVYRDGNAPLTNDFPSRLSGDYCLIEIPHDITTFKRLEPEGARAWREATRNAFQAALRAGFVVEELLRVAGEPVSRWFYLLARVSAK
jgi:predicted GNAT superfamily acetyltransferase